MKQVYLKARIRPLFYINLWCIKFIHLLNAEKGYEALDVMQERLEKKPELFIKIVRSDKNGFLKSFKPFKQSE